MNPPNQLNAPTCIHPPPKDIPIHSPMWEPPITSYAPSATPAATTSPASHSTPYSPTTLSPSRSRRRLSYPIHFFPTSVSFSLFILCPPSSSSSSSSLVSLPSFFFFFSFFLFFLLVDHPPPSIFLSTGKNKTGKEKEETRNPELSSAIKHTLQKVLSPTSITSVTAHPLQQAAVCCSGVVVVVSSSAGFLWLRVRSMILRTGQWISTVKALKALLGWVDVGELS